MFTSNSMKKLAIFCFTNLLLMGQAFASFQYSTIEDMLAAQKTIRVLVDHAPGFGNQAASINMMNRLRQMHFAGTYEVVYPDEMQNKIIQLFNLPASLPDVYHFEDAAHYKVDFIREGYYMNQLKNNLIEPIALGISGAHDSDEEEDCDNNESKKNTNKTSNCIIYDNLSKFMKVNVYLQLQPWYMQEHVSDYISTPNEAKTHITPKGKYWIYPYSQFADTKNYLENTKEGRDFSAQHPGLETLINHISQQKINFMSVYGYYFQKQYNDGDKYPFPQNILQVLTAARFAQMSGNKFAKPLIIAIYYDYKTEISELKNLFQTINWGEYEKIGGQQARDAIQAVGLAKPQVLSLASLDDADITQKIQALMPGQILLLSMGSLPKIVFDGLYSYTGENIWPAIREGESSLSLLLQTGKPHFRCANYYPYEEDPAFSNWEIGFDLIKDSNLKKSLASFYRENGFCDNDSWINNPGVYKQLGNFIIDASNSSSSLSQYFVDIKADTQNLKNDRIYRGLEETMKIMSKN